MQDLEDKSKLIFRYAEYYSRGAKYLNLYLNIDSNLFIPKVLLESLSLELYFKALYYIKFNKDFKIKDKHFHNFKELFLQLPEEIKKSMSEEFARILSVYNNEYKKQYESIIGQKFPEDLLSYLESWSIVFTKVRYLCEKPDRFINMLFFSEKETVVSNAIFRLRQYLNNYY